MCVISKCVVDTFTMPLLCLNFTSRSVSLVSPSFSSLVCLLSLLSLGGEILLQQLETETVPYHTFLDTIAGRKSGQSQSYHNFFLWT